MFIYFCFFIARYNFEDAFLKDMSFYRNKWNETFCQNKEDVEHFLEVKSNEYINKYKLENSNLILKIYKYRSKKIEIKEIKNFDKYCIVDIINYELDKSFFHHIDDSYKEIDINDFSIYKTMISDYSLEKYLKFDLYKDYHINKI